MSGIRDSADPTVTHMARTTEMLKKYPLPWRVSADKPGMSAVVAANGRAVAGSLICRVMGGSVAAERQPSRFGLGFARPSTSSIASAIRRSSSFDFRGPSAINGPRRL